MARGQRMRVMNTPIEGSQTALETLVLKPVAGILGVTVTPLPRAASRSCLLPSGRSNTLHYPPPGTMRYALRDKSVVCIQTRPANISANSSKPDATPTPTCKAALLPLVFVMFAYATGGPFGLEDMVTTSGPGLTLLYHLFIPFFWCIPVSLVAAELTTAISVEGGFYPRVLPAFGGFLGFLAGWLNLRRL